MKQNEQNQYVKRTQKVYIMSFKLQLVQEIERGEASIYAIKRKYGIQSRSANSFTKPDLSIVLAFVNIGILY